MAVGDTYVFPGFLTPVLTPLFFPKPPTTFLTCFCRGETRKYAAKKSRLNRGSNSQPPGHESDTLTTEPPGRGGKRFRKTLWKKVKLLIMSNFTFFHNVFYTIWLFKSFNSHIWVVVCRFFEFGTVWKWRTREWVNVKLRKCNITICGEKNMVLSRGSYIHDYITDRNNCLFSWYLDLLDDGPFPFRNQTNNIYNIHVHCFNNPYNVPLIY